MEFVYSLTDSGVFRSFSVLLSLSFISPSLHGVPSSYRQTFPLMRDTPQAPSDVLQLL